MCGIAGVINCNPVDLQRLSQTLHHRGPDDQAIYQDGVVAFIHTRLAIQDIHLGKQPFSYQNYMIIFNGEIYNHKKLRKHLTEFSFKTNSDTETLLYLFVKYRYDMFTMIDGMFAFCIYDKTNQQIILARDRAGKKPLYYFHLNEQFIFASELNTIKAAQKLSILSEAIESYLRIGMIWQPFTPFQHVYKLEAATYLEFNIGTSTIKKTRYFHLLDVYQLPTSSKTLSENVTLLETKLIESISDRISSSDVEVGVFLSGGIDSNLIAAIASKFQPNIKTFTVKFPGSYDESYLAKLTSQKYNTNHIELALSPTFSNDIDKILLAYGEPFMDSSAIPSFYVAKAAGNYVKVVLSGDGADELFAGYRRYISTVYGLTNFSKIFYPLLKILPNPRSKQSVYNYLYRLISIANKSGLNFYLSATTDVFEDVANFKNNKIIASLADFIDKVFSLPITLLNKMLYLDFNVILFCDLLVKVDIASMANSLEVRSPFLSKSILEFAPTLKDDNKINHFKTKFILRRLAEKYLPRQLINQPKRGFEVPLRQWIDNDLYERIHDRLTLGNYAENFLDISFIQALLHNKTQVPSEKRAKMLWSLYCLQVWYENT